MRPAPPSLVGTVIDLVEAGGLDLARLGLAFARVAPTAALVPAFGLRAFSPAQRAAIGLAFALIVAPAIGPPAPGMPWTIALVTELLRGLPIAIAAALPLYVALTVGATIDALRSAPESASLPFFEGRATPLGAVLGLLACTFFFAGGGPARVALALASPPPFEAALAARVARDLAGGITIAVAIASPLVAASVTIEVALALIGRAAAPTPMTALVAPVRSAALLIVAALLFERLADAIARLVG